LKGLNPPAPQKCVYVIRYQHAVLDCYRASDQTTRKYVRT